MGGVIVNGGDDLQGQGGEGGEWGHVVEGTGGENLIQTYLGEALSRVQNDEDDWYDWYALI